jgi:hypothetical protein
MRSSLPGARLRYGVSLAGVDFSPVAIDQATRRAALFGMTAEARFRRPGSG